MTRAAISLSLSLLLLVGCKSDQELALEALAKANASAVAAQAIPLLKEAVRLDPALHSAWAAMSKRQLEAGQADDAKMSIERAITLSDQAPYRAALGDVELARSEFANAIAAYDQALEQGGVTTTIHPGLAAALQGRGDASAAEAAELGGEDETEATAAKYNAAITDYGRALSLDASRSVLHFRLGEAHRAVAPHDRTTVEHQSIASEAYRAAITAEVEPFASHLAIAEMLLHPIGGMRMIALLGWTEEKIQKVETLLDAAEPLASTDEERARLASAKSELEEKKRSAAEANREAVLAAAANSGILGVLGTIAPTSPFGTSTALGNDPLAAMGGLVGDQIGENFGFGGLGLRGTGVGGGGTGEGTIGLGRIGMIGGGGGGTGSGYGRGGSGFGRGGSGSPRPRVRIGRATVAGPLAPEIIRRVVRRHMSELRYCYEQQLQSHPDLAGRLELKFVITPSGSVQSSQVTSHLSEHAVGTCAARAVRRWTFPSSPSPVVVNYPFIFGAPTAP